MNLTLFNTSIITKKPLQYSVLTIQPNGDKVKYYVIDEYGIHSRAEIDLTYFKNKYCITKSYDSWHNWTDSNFLRLRRFK